MLARLDEAFHEQARFVADASHELRTPLTVMRGTVSVALSRPRKASDYQQVLQEVEDETERMSRLVEQLLALARADAGRLSVQRQRVELSGLLADLADHARALAELKGLDVFAQITQGLEANTDPDLLTQIVLNLLDNAIKYTPSGAIHLSAKAIESHLIQITVADTGPGIPQEHLARIFQRFYRVDTARSRDVGGAGLGLALAREYARLLGGDLNVASAPGDGATFALTLPMAQSD
jgi:signal transduction histidine kinase